MRTLAFALALVAGQVHAGEQTGTVRMDHGTYGSGVNSAGQTFFFLDGGAKAGTPAFNTYLSRWVINNNWPAAKFQVAVLLAAVTSGKTVTVRGSGDCANWVDSETAIDIRLNN